MLPDLVSVIMSTVDPLQDRTQKALKHLARSDAIYELILLNRNHKWTTGTIVNQGIAASVGEYVAFLCDDCFIEPDALKLLKLALKDPKVGVVGALLKYPNGLVQHAGGGLKVTPTDPKRNGEKVLAVDVVHIGQGDPVQAFTDRDVDFVTGAFMMTRRDVLDTVGWYAIDCKLAWGDVDFCLRVREAGYSVRFISAAHAVHIEAATRGKTLGPLGWFLTRWVDSPLVRGSIVLAGGGS